MYTKYLYASPKNLKDDRFLIGARITLEQENNISTQEIYIGKAYSLEDFLKIAKYYKIKTSSEDIKNEYERRKAVGIIYFYNICKFGYLEEKDMVVKNKDELNELILSFNDQEELALKRKKNI